MIRARDIRDRLKGRVDEQVMYCFEALAENQSAMRQQTMELASQMNQMADIIASFTVVAENMKNAVETMKKMEGNVDYVDPDAPKH